MSDDPECRPGQVIRHLLRRGFDRENEARSAVFGVARVFLPSISEDALVRMIERENYTRQPAPPIATQAVSTATRNLTNR